MLLSSSVSAQVIIKERIEINPQKILPSYPIPQYTPCGPYPGLIDIHNPRQAVWNGSSFWLDPYQQLFVFQQSGGYHLNQEHIYNIETTAGGDYFSITKLGGIDPITGEFIEPEDMGDTLLNVMGVDLIGTGEWEITLCGTYQKENGPDYQCHFSKDAPQGTEVIVKITDLTEGDPPKYFHTFIEIPSMIVEEGYTTYMQHYYSHNIDMWVYDPGNCTLGCGGHLPSWVTFTVEIVQGQEYGSIHNLLTDESADYFTNIETISSWAGQSEIRWFEFVADGVQPDTSSPAHVVIRYTPSDASVGIVEHNIYVEYNDVVPVEEGILVQFEDQVIAPGDTTQIILKRQNSDGTLENFSQWDSFEIGMIEGCDAGLILYNGIMENYFAEVYQPIYFVAANDLTETDTVMVRVGLIEGGGSSRPVNKGGEEKEAIITNPNKNKKEPEPLPMNPSTYCFPENFWTPHDLEGIANLVVGDECDNLPTEQQEISYTLLEQPEFFIVPHSDLEELKLVELIQVCNDTAHPNQNGGSIPVEYKRYRYDYTTNSFKISWVLEPYKGIDGYVHYYFKNQQSNQSTSILFDYVTGVCYTKINKPWLTLIENISDIDEPTKIPSSDDKQAFKDFCGHLCYPNERATYVLVEIIQIHESEHMNDFEEIISRSFPKLAQKIEDHKDLCESYDETVRINAEKVIYDMIENFIDEAISEFQAKSGEPNSETELNNERKIQGRPSITNRIEDYKNALKNRFSILKDEVCQKCSYEEQN